MKSCLIIRLLVLSAAVATFVQVASASNNPPHYPLNFEPYIVVKIQGPKIVIRGGKPWVKLTVTNTGKQETPFARDLTLTLLQGADDEPPLSPVKAIARNPQVTFGRYDKNEWIVGKLRAGQSKTFSLRVLIPKAIPNFVSQWCFRPYVTMSSSTTITSWSKSTPDDKDLCADVRGK